MSISPTAENKFVLEGNCPSDATVLKPEDSIPDLPENFEVREFLRTAPSKGLFMPLGKEVKVMQCWRCKAYGHRTGDRECPMSISGNLQLDSERRCREDPMSNYSSSAKREHKYERVEFLKSLVDDIRREEMLRNTKKSKRKDKIRKHKRKSKAEKVSRKS